MSQYQKQKLRYFLTQVKDTIRIDGEKNYKLVTISNTGIIKERKTELGLNIKAAVLNQVHKGDFIYSRLAAHTGSFGIIPEELDLATASNEMPCFKIDKTKILPEYLDFILKQKSFINKLKLLTQGMGRVRIKEKQFLDVEIEYHPNITTQHIFLKQFMSIHKYERILTEESIYQSTYITKLRQAILQEAIEGKMTADWRKKNPVRKGDPDYDAEALLDKIQAEKEKLIKAGKIKKQKPFAPIKPEEVPFELPEEWVWTRLGQIAEILGGYAYNSTDFKKEGINQVLRLGNIRPGKIRLEDKAVFISKQIAENTKDFLLHKNDILITMTGTRGKRDYLYTVRIMEQPYRNRHLFLNQRVGAIRFYLFSEFFEHLFTLDKAKDNVYATSTGSANQANVGMIALKNWVIPLPPKAEQQAIVNRVEKLLSMVDELEKQVSERKEQSEQLMQAVLREAFEGGK